VKTYADTSALIAWFHPADQFASAMTDWCRERSPEFCWNALLRMELRHNLRRLSGKYAAAAWHAYRASESTRKLRLATDPLSDLLERADELSARHAQESHAGTWDFVHVAAAQQSRAEIFVTCDVAQAELARVAGLPKVHLFGV
jgi:predicted nucleic acid-binding protein